MQRRDVKKPPRSRGGEVTKRPLIACAITLALSVALTGCGEAQTLWETAASEASTAAQNSQADLNINGKISDAAAKAKAAAEAAAREAAAKAKAAAEAKARELAEKAKAGLPTAVPTPTAPAAPSPTAPAGVVAQAKAALPTIPVKGAAPKTGYARAQFGQAWTDDNTMLFGRNGCDTRNDILRRDLTGAVLKPGTRDCVVLSGVLNDPYTGKTINFVRGNDTSSAVQIDHRVPLSWAWQHGAQSWTAAKRVDFANDPDNLVAVDGPTNQAKGDAGPGAWLPPNKAYRCEYVSRFTLVTAKHGLWLTQGDADGIARVLAGC